MSNFEKDLRLMIKNLEYREVKYSFSKRLANDLKLIKNAKELLVNVDKSQNIYKISDENYRKYLVENITKTYKK